jgi:hypothetical protein
MGSCKRAKGKGGPSQLRRPWPGLLSPRLLRAGALLTLLRHLPLGRRPSCKLSMRRSVRHGVTCVEDPRSLFAWTCMAPFF